MEKHVQTQSEFSQTKDLSSFLMAGFECTFAQVNQTTGKRFDLLAASKHDTLCSQDYKMIRAEGMQTVREGLAWSQIDKGNGVYDFSRFKPMMKTAQKEGIQQIWDLCHFDYPSYLDAFSPEFVSSFAAYAKEAVRQIRKTQTGVLHIVPINEISFFAWMCQNGKWAPFAKGRGTEFKKQLVRASVAAMDAMWEVDPDIKFIHTDPYMHRAPLRKKNEREQKFCDRFNSQVRFHSWDMITGKRNPELGGDPKYMSYVGVSYYFYNQQFVKIDLDGHRGFRSLSLQHPQRLPLTYIVDELYERYQVPIIITETGSYRSRRDAWWNYILNEATLCLNAKKPLLGLCAYPTLDILRGAGFIVPQSGLWDFDQAKKSFERIPYEPALESIRAFRSDLLNFSQTQSS